MKHLLFVVLVLCLNLPAAFCQTSDWRNIVNGNPIYTNGYIDQPYVVVLGNGDWFCVFTTGSGAEGTGGQHIVCSTSKDKGITWSEPVKIEQPGKESASWAMPYLTDFGRIYVFYDYNGDKIHELNNRKNIREDMLGWYCYKYTDDNGKTWSARYRLPVRMTVVDFENDWNGKVQILWGIGKPIDAGKGMMFAFSKIGKYLVDETEGWFFRCDNINSERDPDKLNWIMLPEGDHGLENHDYGSVNAEQNIVQMSNGTIYCMYRTISGHPLCSYSYDRGVSWTKPQVPLYYTGSEIKHPRACPRIWKCENGKYLFWHHNNGGWNFRNRNPVWISGGYEQDGKIIWTQPEILFYDTDIEKRMSYPDLIQQDGRYWITETNKINARSHEVPDEFLEMLWSQPFRNEMATKGLILEQDASHLLSGKEIKLPEPFNLKQSSGMTIDMVIGLQDLGSGQVILDNLDENGRGFILETGEYGSVVLKLSSGQVTGSWNSDQGLITAYKPHCITVIVDNGASLIQFVVDGKVCDGGQYRQFGWGRYDPRSADFELSHIRIGNLPEGEYRPKGGLMYMRLYNRPLLNTEAIGNHRLYKGNAVNP